MMPWGAFHNPNPVCAVVTLAFFLLAVSHMYDWQADELSYRLQLESLELEGTLREIEPRALPFLDAASSAWALAAAFIVLTVVLAIFCGRPVLSP